MVVTISEFARHAGVTADTLRYYERRRLLSKVPRAPNGYRLYDDELTGRLRFIKSPRHVGIRLHDVKELLEVMDRGMCPCGHTATVVERRLAEIDAELGRLFAMRDQLMEMGEQTEACSEPDRPQWWFAPSHSWKGGD
jgi:DNA-binding transcriptional MerR regulator